MAEDPKRLTRAHKIALGVISAACCCLIGVSAFTLAAPDALSQVQDNQAEATQEADSASTDYGNDAPQEGQSDDATQDGNAQDESSSASGSQSKSTEKENGTSSSSGNKASSSSNSSSSNGNSQSTTASSTASSTVTVSVSVSSSAADGRVSGSAHPTFKKGATGLSVSTKSSQYGLYVSAIGGLAEFEYGGKSGWMYSVNGSAPNVSCGKYVLKDGDTVSWYYVK